MGVGQASVMYALSRPPPRRTRSVMTVSYGICLSEMRRLTKHLAQRCPHISLLESLSYGEYGMGASYNIEADLWPCVGYGTVPNGHGFSRHRLWMRNGVVCTHRSSVGRMRGS